MEHYDVNLQVPCYPNMEHIEQYPHQAEYLSTLYAYRNSFDMAYTNHTVSNNVGVYPRTVENVPMPEYPIPDDASSDSGLPSDSQEDFSGEVSPGSSYWPGEGVKRRGEKPLSAWKLKQLRLTPAGVKKRRRDANARERKRMNGLNEAFEKLRDTVPGLSDKAEKNKKLSKMDTLQMANLYIRHLASLLNLEQDPTPQ